MNNVSYAICLHLKFYFKDANFSIPETVNKRVSRESKTENTNLLLEFEESLLLLVVLGALDLSLGFQLVDNILVLPSDLVRKTTN